MGVRSGQLQRSKCNDGQVASGRAGWRACVGRRCIHTSIIYIYICTHVCTSMCIRMFSHAASVANFNFCWVETSFLSRVLGCKTLRPKRSVRVAKP